MQEFRKTEAPLYLSNAVSIVSLNTFKQQYSLTNRLVNCCKIVFGSLLDQQRCLNVGVPFFFRSTEEEKRFYRFYFKNNFASVRSPFLAVPNSSVLNKTIQQFSQSRILSRICITIRNADSIPQSYQTLYSDKVTVIFNTDIIKPDTVLEAMGHHAQTGATIMLSDTPMSQVQPYFRDIWRALHLHKPLYFQKNSLTAQGLNIALKAPMLANSLAASIAEIWYKQLFNNLKVINSSYA